MTDPSTEPREGWYGATTDNGSIKAVHYAFGRWWDGVDYHRDSLPPGWTLGPRIDDLMRDAARWRYVVEELSPEDFATIDAEELGEWVDAEIARESGE